MKFKRKNKSSKNKKASTGGESKNKKASVGESKNKKASTGGESPLMAAGSTEPLESRRQERQERDERRKEKSERKAESGLASTSLKKKSKPKLSRKEQDAKDAKLGCCHKFGTLLVKLVHVFDGLIGLTFLVYGSLIMTQFKEPAMDAVITTLTYGSIMLFASTFGVIGFYSRLCRRMGLLISAYSSPIIVCFYIFAMIAELGLSASIFDYLTEHMDVLYLNEGEIATLKQIVPFFYIVIASLTAIEICRFLILSELRESLLRFDSANRRISSNDSKASKSKSSNKKTKATSSTRSGLTEPFLGDEETGVRGQRGGDY